MKTNKLYIPGLLSICLLLLSGCEDSDLQSDDEFLPPPYAHTESLVIDPSMTSATLKIRVEGVHLTSVGAVFATDNYLPTKETGIVFESDNVSSGLQYVTVTGLDPAKSYYIRAFATNDRGTHYTNVKSTLESVTEVTLNGVTYPTIFYGGRLILAENLRNVPTGVFSNTSDKALATYCFSGDQEEYGCLMLQGAAKLACEELGGGWHLPTNAEWGDILNDIEEENGGNLRHATEIKGRYGIKAAIAMKRPEGWLTGSATPGTNSSGFNAVPSGYTSGGANVATSAQHVGQRALYWSASNFANGEGMVRILSRDWDNVQLDGNNPANYGFAVRCVR